MSACLVCGSDVSGTNVFVGTDVSVSCMSVIQQNGYSLLDKQLPTIATQ